MKMKRFISAIAALTMSVSCFAGLAITANAETQVISENFDGVDVNSAWTTQTAHWITTNSGAKGNAPTIQTDTDGNKYWKWSSGSGNLRGFYLTLPSQGTALYQKVKFDFAIWLLSSGGTDKGYDLIDSDGKVVMSLTLPATSNQTSNDDFELLVNGNPTSGLHYAQGKPQTTPITWYTIEANLDFVSHTLSYKIYSPSAPGTVISSGSNIDFANKTASNITRMGFAQQAYTNGVFYATMFDNFYLASLTAPTITIAEADLTQEVASGSQDVSVDISDYSSVSVTSDNTDVLTVSDYDNTNKKITLTYVSNGVANVTVSATSTDGVTVSKTIAVTAGAVAKHDITIKYVLASDHTTEIAAADTTTFAQKAEGSAITLSEITDTVTNKIYKNASNEVVEKANAIKEYVYTGLDPATITADNDYTVTADATIYAEYAAYDLWTVTAKDSINEETIATGTGFAGDSDTFTYSYHKYLTDANNKVTATADASTYQATVTPTQSETITVDYTAYTGEHSLYYADLGAADASNAKLSNNNGNRRMGSGKNAITVKESGIYTVSYPAYKNSNGNGTVLVYRNGNTEDIVVPEKTIDYSINYLASQSAENVALYEGDEIYVKNDGANAVVDYILLEKTGDLVTSVADIAEVETAFALTSVTGKLGTEPTFENISTFTTKYASTKQLKLAVTNPVEDVYPVVTVAGKQYALTADDVTAVTANHVSTFYFEFAAETAEKLKEFGTITISYGTGEDKVDKTYNFNPSSDPGDGGNDD